MDALYQLTVKDPVNTELLGKTLGRFMAPGQVITLNGELGAGKTTFVKGIASGLGVPKEVVVCSPSYTLVNEYEGRIPLFHFDLYRLEGAKDIHELGYDEYLEGEGVSVMEWSDIAPEILPPYYLDVRIAIVSESERAFSFRGHGGDYEKIVGRLKSSPETASN